MKPASFYIYISGQGLVIKARISTKNSYGPLLEPDKKGGVLSGFSTMVTMYFPVIICSGHPIYILLFLTDLSLNVF